MIIRTVKCTPTFRASSIRADAADPVRNGEIDGTHRLPRPRVLQSGATAAPASSDSQAPARSPTPHHKLPGHRLFPRDATPLNPRSTCESRSRRKFVLLYQPRNYRNERTRMSDGIFWTPASGLTLVFRRKDLSPVELVDRIIQRAERLQPHLNFLVLLDENGARAAGASEARWMKGRAAVTARWHPDLDTRTPRRSKAGRRARLPRDGRNTGVGRRAGRRPPARRGLPILGKSTTPEFGWKALTNSPLQGVDPQPLEPGHSPGGSSGGASSMTAAGVAPFNHGNDGGGSIRIPAAHTGLVGLKPCYGRIPQYPATRPLPTSSARACWRAACSTRRWC